MTPGHKSVRAPCREQPSDQNPALSHRKKHHKGSGSSGSQPSWLCPQLPPPILRLGHPASGSSTSSSFCWKSLLISSFWAWQWPNSCCAAPSKRAFFSCGDKGGERAAALQPVPSLQQAH